MFSKLRRPCAQRSLRVKKKTHTEDDLPSWLEYHKLDLKADELSAEYEKRKQYLALMTQRKREGQKSIKELEERRFTYDMFLKEKESEANTKKAEREMQKLKETEEMVDKLKSDIEGMYARKKQLLRQVERHSIYKVFMEKAHQQSQFRDLDELASHLDNLLQTRDKLFEKRTEVEVQTDQQKKTLQMLENQHNLLLLQRNNELSQLQSELDKSRALTLTWEKKWDRIQETAAKKLVVLGQIKMATLSLYEMTGGNVGEEGVDMNDTEMQLDQIKYYMKDLIDIIIQYHCLLSENKKLEKT